jgi:hypothetical protein
VQAAGAGEAMVLRAAVAGESRLLLPGGRDLALPLPPGADVTALAGTPRAWAAAGTTAERAGGTGLVVVAGDERRARRLPSPAAATPRLRQQPVPLSGDRGLAGVAWLEGDRRDGLGVVARAWDGKAWGRPATVAAAESGSQLALAGTVLGDGSWLLVWAAFDGSDDEILWSVHRDGEWSAPRRLGADNAVPDITPAVVPAGRDGAVVAWSRYDGRDYRLVSARFDGRGFGAVETVGPPGSLYPSFVAAAAGSYLLYRTAVPRGWQVVEIDAEGGRGRFATVTVEGSERPVVVPAAVDGVRLLFAGEGAEATAGWRERR